MWLKDQSKRDELRRKVAMGRHMACLFHLAANLSDPSWEGLVNMACRIMKVAVGLGPSLRLSGAIKSLAYGFDLVGDYIRMLLLARCSNRGC
jgi:hypothetical protein